MIAVIGAATAADADALASIHAEAFADPWDAGVFGCFLKSQGVAAWTAGAPAVGLVMCRRIVDEAEILTLAVHPDHRRRGVAIGLLDHAAEWARNAGARALFLEVAQDNGAGLALYRGAGFTKVGRRRAYYSRPTGAIDALVLRLDLAARP